MCLHGRSWKSIVICDGSQNPFSSPTPIWQILGISKLLSKPTFSVYQAIMPKDIQTTFVFHTTLKQFDCEPLGLYTVVVVTDSIPPRLHDLRYPQADKTASFYIGLSGKRLPLMVFTFLRTRLVINDITRWNCFRVAVHKCIVSYVKDLCNATAFRWIEFSGNCL